MTRKPDSPAVAARDTGVAVALDNMGRRPGP